MLWESSILGHVQEGLSYWLYADALDSAYGCILEQIQQIKIADLKRIKVCMTLKKT